MNASGSLPFLEASALFWGGFSPDPLDLDFGVTGAGPAERKERAVADMLRAEKRGMPLGSHGTCVEPLIGRPSSWS